MLRWRLFVCVAVTKVKWGWVLTIADEYIYKDAKWTDAVNKDAKWTWVSIKILIITVMQLFIFVFVLTFERKNWICQKCDDQNSNVLLC